MPAWPRDAYDLIEAHVESLGPVRIDAVGVVNLRGALGGALTMDPW